MGKRRLYFDKRKNYERKKWSSKSHQLKAATLESQKFVVRINRSHYDSAETSSTSLLHNRLQFSRITSGWTVSMMSQESTIIIYKIFYIPAHQSTYTLTLTINKQFLFSIKMDNIEVSKDHCLLLQSFGILNTCSNVLKAIKSLNASKICKGNNDSKFVISCNKRNGKFKNKSS